MRIPGAKNTELKLVFLLLVRTSYLDRAKIPEISGHPQSGIKSCLRFQALELS